jgi:hypothetical protein
MLLLSDHVRTTVEGESIARTTYSIILFFSFARARIFDAESSSSNEEKKEEEEERKNLPDVYFVALGRKKREKEKNERNMHSRFDNQLEAAAFNISPNEREYLFAIQLVKYTIE